MSGNKYGMVIDFDSLTAILDILMDAGYKGDENARLLYLDITESEGFTTYLKEKEARENGGLKNFMPRQGNPNIRYREGTKFISTLENCLHPVVGRIPYTSISVCALCGKQLNMFHGSEIAHYEKPLGKLTADGAHLEKCFQLEAHKDE